VLRLDILLTHGYCLFEDPHERKVMKPYPPLGILYISAYLKRAGFAVAVYDMTFSSLADFEASLARERPPVVGIYTNMMTKFNVLKMIALGKAAGATGAGRAGAGQLRRGVPGARRGRGRHRRGRGRARGAAPAPCA
jgi:hypothetical protein